MATITKSVDVTLNPAQVWDAVRDWGHVHQRLCPDVLTDCQVEEGARVVTFAGGLVAKELIVTVDAWSGPSSAARCSAITTAPCRCWTKALAAASSGPPTSCRTTRPSAWRVSWTWAARR
jgi:hypothetical protein